MYTDAQPSLVPSSGVVSNGVLQVCSDITVNLVCSHNSTQTGWEILFSGFGARKCFITSLYLRTYQFSPQCGSYRIFDTVSSGQLMSTLVLPVDQFIDGARVTCIAGDSSSDPQVGSYTLQVIGEKICNYI